jgi:hypothetical protein
VQFSLRIAGVLVPRIPRAIGIILCGVALFVPQVRWDRSGQYDTFNVIAVLHFAFPVFFYVLVNLSIDEGRDRERTEHEKPPTDQ